MDKEQPAENISDDQNQPEAIEPEVSDVDYKHVRGLMYALVTICVFCASILLGPDEQILPADGDLKIPIVNLTIKQGSFLYFGPIIIVCVSMYTYLFLLKILARVKAGRVNSDQYIFTMKSPAAQVATYCIFFWLPALVLFAFAYKGLPRPEAANLLGLSLVFLITIISIQLVLRIYKINFLGIIAVSIFCVAVVLYGFVEDKESSLVEDRKSSLVEDRKSVLVEDRGWLEWVRGKLNSRRSMSLDKVDLAKRDLRNVEIRNAQAESIILNGADLRGVVIKDADLVDAKLVNADLRNAEIRCSDLTSANFYNANLVEAKLTMTNFRDANFRRAKLQNAIFYSAASKVSCSRTRLKRTSLFAADMEGADLTAANLSKVSLGNTNLDGSILFGAKIIGARVTGSSFLDKTDLRKVDFRCSHLRRVKMSGAELGKAELGGIDFTAADLSNADLSKSFFGTLDCSNSCIDIYIGNKDTGKEACRGEDIRKIKDQKSQNQKSLEILERCKCVTDKDGLRTAKLHYTNLQFASLQESHLEGAELTGADLQYANLQESHLEKADLTNANLGGANLYKAHIHGADLEDSKLLLTKLIAIKGLECEQLKKAKYWMTTIRGDDDKCGEKYLNFGELSGSLKRIGRQTVKNFHKVIEEFARSSRERLHKKIEKGGQIDTFRILEHAEMSGVNLTLLNLEDIWLNFAKLNNARLLGTKLKRAKLVKAELEGTNLTAADLEDAVLTGANLNGANLERAILKRADLRGADLNGANLKDVQGLTCKQLMTANNFEKAFRDRVKHGCGREVPVKKKSFP